jgi:hypothetical protein
MLGIKLETGVEQRIIDTAVSRWNKAEEFVWADAVGSPRSASGGDASPGTAKTEEKDQVPVQRERGLGSPIQNQPSSAPQLVSIPCPEVKQFRPQATETWSENPTSFLSMLDEPDNPVSDVDGPKVTYEKRALPLRTDYEPRTMGQGE